MEIIWSSTAKRRAEEIVDYISDDNLDAALELIEDIQHQVQLLKDNPKIGRVAPVLGDESVRELVVHKNYIVVYELASSYISILTIRHSRQNTDK